VPSKRLASERAAGEHDQYSWASLPSKRLKETNSLEQPVAAENAMKEDQLVDCCKSES